MTFIIIENSNKTAFENELQAQIQALETDLRTFTIQFAVSTLRYCAFITVTG